jgi:hypothetical protein
MQNGPKGATRQTNGGRTADVPAVSAACSASLMCEGRGATAVPRIAHGFKRAFARQRRPFEGSARVRIDGDARAAADAPPATRLTRSQAGNRGRFEVMHGFVRMHT